MAITPSPLSTNTSLSSTTKRKHKAPKIKTEDYHEQVVKKRRIANSSKASKPVTNKKSQTTITNFKLTKNLTTLKEEDYFINPSNVDGFNLISLRRHFHSIVTKSNIVALMKKSIINNNTIPSTKKTPTNKRYSQRSILSKEIIKPVTIEKGCIYLHSSLNRCYLEDFISLPSGSQINLLLPKSLVISSNKKKGTKRLDDKLLLLVDAIDPPLTQIGGSTSMYYVLYATIISTPNRDASCSGIDKGTLKGGLHGVHKYGSTIAVEGSDVTPLIKWRDVLFGCKNGIQVRYHMLLLSVLHYILFTIEHASCNIIDKIQLYKIIY